MSTKLTKCGFVDRQRDRKYYRDREGNRITGTKADRMIRQAADEFLLSRGHSVSDGFVYYGKGARK